MRASGILLAAAIVHFVSVLLVCCAQIVALIADGHTALPTAGTRLVSEMRGMIVSPPRDREPYKSARHLAKTYLNLAGIQSGSGLFAPNVPDGFRLRFELRDQNNIIQTGFLSPQRGETDLRLSSLLDALGRTMPDEVREVLLRFVAHSIFDVHPEATEVSLAMESVTTPTLAEFQTGKERSYNLVYSYDYGRGESGVALP
jgi:hypothetical protein